MATLADPPPIPSAAPLVQPYLFYRHALVTRITHWINALAILFLIGTGLNIFNAHPALYWGQFGADDDDARRWLEIGSADSPSGQPYGFLRIGSLTVKTTGVLGVSASKAGAVQAIGYPHWATFPSNRDLATARNWHFFFAWVLILNGLLYLVWGAITGHIRRDVLPRLRELSPASIGHDIWTHIRLKFPKGEDAKRYHPLQKISYAGTALVLLPLVVLTGLTMSPGIDAAWPWLVTLFGGRPSARSIHWIAANLIMIFIIVHVLMVILAGPINEIRSMITGRFRIDPETGK